MDSMKLSIYKEIKFGLIASGGDLAGILKKENFRLDQRPELSQERNPDDYPWLIFYRVVAGEQQDIKWRRERFIFELIGLSGASGKDDVLLEQMHDIILDHFSFEKKRIGGYTGTGDVDATLGHIVKPMYIDTADGSFEGMSEKRQLMQFAFSGVRA